MQFIDRRKYEEKITVCNDVVGVIYRHPSFRDSNLYSSWVYPRVHGCLWDNPVHHWSYLLASQKATITNPAN